MTAARYTLVRHLAIPTGELPAGRITAIRAGEVLPVIEALRLCTKCHEPLEPGRAPNAKVHLSCSLSSLSKTGTRRVNGYHRKP